MTMTGRPDSAFRLLLLFCALLMAGGVIGGCSASSPRFSDALRIKPEAEGKYQRAPNSQQIRDGRTLRGTVAAVAMVMNESDPDRIDTQYVFLDAGSADRPENYELIPFADVEQISDLLRIPVDSTKTRLNLVESFNNTQMIPELREVPIYTGPGVPPPGGGDGDCKCKPFGFTLPVPELECGKRRYDWYFVELRAAYGSYLDFASRTSAFGRDDYAGEIAAGIRFGGYDEWGAGLLFSSGLPIINSFDGTSSSRPLVLAHLRYQTPGPVSNILGICMKPFVYGEFGMAVDDATVNLMKLNLSSSEDCNECNQLITQLEAEGSLPEVDFGFPISMGLGIGVDVPLASFLDASVDVGFRSISIGEEAPVAGFSNVPSRRRVNGFFLRMGLTY